MLRQRLVELGVAGRKLEIDGLSRWKLRGLERIVAETADEFGEGRKVPLFAVAYRMEAMGVRVLERHLEVCAGLEERVGQSLPTRRVLERITADERRHAQACERTLLRLVADEELPALTRLLCRVDAIERAFGISSSVGLWVAGCYFQLLGAAQRLLCQMPGRRVVH
ncbi:MAG: hypothetical protein ACYCWW_00670 [Deltaproteobacteria bacterium]